MPQLVVKGVSKNFGEGDSLVHALSDINLSVEKRRISCNYGSKW